MRQHLKMKIAATYPAVELTLFLQHAIKSSFALGLFGAEIQFPLIRPAAKSDAAKLNTPL
jgi:hypothetical protein